MPQSIYILAALLALPGHDFIFASNSYAACASVQATGQLRDRARPDVSSTKDPAGDAVNRIRVIVDDVIAESYPELKGAHIRINPFRSQSDYFKARFGVPQYFLPRMRYLVFVNPRVFELQAPEAGVRAIIAHELGHIFYLRERNRLRLLGLVRMTSTRFTAEFERWADLKAISLGYGEGLKEYRRWLYKNVPASRLAEKQRNYFSPDEIDAILLESRKRPELIEYWFKHVPLSLNQILATAR